MIKSITAVKRGYGRARYRSVSGLAAEEREVVKSGGIVYFEIYKTSHMQSSYKVVTCYNGRFDSREPSEAELVEIRKLELEK